MSAGEIMFPPIINVGKPPWGTLLPIYWKRKGIRVSFPFSSKMLINLLSDFLRGKVIKTVDEDVLRLAPAWK